MYTGPHLQNEGLVFGYDIGLGSQYDPGVESRYYKGRPITNYASLGNYSIYNTNATNYRNQSFPPPPSPGYEVVKVAVDSYGSYGHSILWNAGYPNNNVATISNSIYAWLEAGTYVQVGQHWFPWYYGTPKYIEKGKWVRINETYTINEGNSYGSAALAYSTDGVAYFSMPQFEYAPINSPYVNGTRSTTQSLLDIKRSATLDTANVSFNSSGQPTFDGTDYIAGGNLGSMSTFTVEVLFKSTSVTNYRNPIDCNWLIFNGSYSNIGPRLEQNSLGNLSWIVGDTSGNYSGVTSVSSGLAANVYHYAVITKTGSSSFVSYYNGNSVASLSFSNWSGSMSSVNIGRGFSMSSERWFIGDIPAVRIYNRALSDQEIKNNYLAYKGRFNLS